MVWDKRNWLLQAHIMWVYNTDLVWDKRNWGPLHTRITFIEDNTKRSVTAVTLLVTPLGV